MEKFITEKKNVKMLILKINLDNKIVFNVHLDTGYLLRSYPKLLSVKVMEKNLTNNAFGSTKIPIS